MKQKNTETKKRRSGYNPDRTCYLSADGKTYVYETWDSEAKRMIAQRLEVGKDFTEEWTLILDDSDHEIDMNDRREAELRDSLFDAKVKSFRANPDDEDAVNPWDRIPDKHGSPEDEMFTEAAPVNPAKERVRKVIDEDCTERQQNFFYEHFGCGTQLEDMRRAEAAETGKFLSAAAMTNRKNKIIDKAAKALGTERVKRHAYPQKEG